jgi:hypothetical protein
MAEQGERLSMVIEAAKRGYDEQVTEALQSERVDVLDGEQNTALHVFLLSFFFSFPLQTLFFFSLSLLLWFSGQRVADTRPLVNC